MHSKSGFRPKQLKYHGLYVRLGKKFRDFFPVLG